MKKTNCLEKDQRWDKLTVWKEMRDEKKLLTIWKEMTDGKD